MLGLCPFILKAQRRQPVGGVAGGIDPLDPRPNLTLLENKMSQLDNSMDITLATGTSNQRGNSSLVIDEPEEVTTFKEITMDPRDKESTKCFPRVDLLASE